MCFRHKKEHQNKKRNRNASLRSTLKYYSLFFLNEWVRERERGCVRSKLRFRPFGWQCQLHCIVFTYILHTTTKHVDMLPLQQSSLVLLLLCLFHPPFHFPTIFPIYIDPKYMCSLTTMCEINKSQNNCSNCFFGMHHRCRRYKMRFYSFEICFLLNMSALR